MDTLTAIKTRHSTRKFTPEPVSREQIETIIGAGRLAPTARNDQPWEFVVVTEREMLSQIAELTDWGKFIAHAPLCVAVLSSPSKYYLEDCSAAIENILLAATALGLESCWVAGDKKPYAPVIRKTLGAPEDCLLVALLAIGHANDEHRSVPKRDLSSVLHWEKY